jgi:hypothetical protein
MKRRPEAPSQLWKGQTGQINRHGFEVFGQYRPTIDDPRLVPKLLRILVAQYPGSYMRRGLTGQYYHNHYSAVFRTFSYHDATEAYAS